MQSTLVSWLLSAMATWAPPHKADLARYESIAADILSVASDPAEEPLFDGRDGVAKTAVLLAAFAERESGGFRADVDSGRKLGDHGASVCIMQVRVGRGRTAEGWTAHDLLADRTKCIRAALHRMHGSVAACRGLKGADRLGGYTHGRCVRGNEVALFRWTRTASWVKNNPFPEVSALEGAADPALKFASSSRSAKRARGSIAAGP